jgi:hypothetical protein
LCCEAGREKIKVNRLKPAAPEVIQGIIDRINYPGKEIAEWVLKHYHGVKLETTARINGYKPGAVKRGRPRKGVSA